jgi:hypothetical protein
VTCHVINSSQCRHLYQALQTLRDEHKTATKSKPPAFIPSHQEVLAELQAAMQHVVAFPQHHNSIQAPLRSFFEGPILMQKLESGGKTQIVGKAKGNMLNLLVGSCTPTKLWPYGESNPGLMAENHPS